MSLIQHFVNGKSYKGNSNRKGKVFNPATGEQESEVILGSKEDLNNTVNICLLYTSPSPRDTMSSRMPSSA